MIQADSTATWPPQLGTTRLPSCGMTTTTTPPMAYSCERQPPSTKIILFGSPARVRERLARLLQVSGAGAAAGGPS